MNKDKLLQQVCKDIQEKFGNDSSKMFSILIMMIFMDTKQWKIPEYLQNIPELQVYIDYIENSTLLKEIFQDRSS